MNNEGAKGSMSHFVELTFDDVMVFGDNSLKQLFTDDAYIDTVTRLEIPENIGRIKNVKKRFGLHTNPH